MLHPNFHQSRADAFYKLHVMDTGACRHLQTLKLTEGTLTEVQGATDGNFFQELSAFSSLVHLDLRDSGWASAAGTFHTSTETTSNGQGTYIAPSITKHALITHQFMVQQLPHTLSQCFRAPSTVYTTFSC